MCDVVSCVPIFVCSLMQIYVITWWCNRMINFFLHVWREHCVFVFDWMTISYDSDYKTLLVLWLSCDLFDAMMMDIIFLSVQIITSKYYFTFISNLSHVIIKSSNSFGRIVSSLPFSSYSTSSPNSYSNLIKSISCVLPINLTLPSPDFRLDKSASICKHYYSCWSLFVYLWTSLCWIHKSLCAC